MSVKVYTSSGEWVEVGGMQHPNWGNIGGSIDNQVDLKAELDDKQDDILANIPGTSGQFLRRNAANNALEFASGGASGVSDVKVDGATVVDTTGVAQISMTAYRKSADQDVIDATKVDKVTGKGLSTNDYDDVEKAKVATIPSAGIGDGTLTIKQNGAVIGSFKANQAGDVEVTVAPSASGTINDVKVNNVSVVEAGGIAKIDLTPYAKTADVPTKLSQLTNDSAFITKDVTNLTNYYSKTETYTKAESDTLVSGKVDKEAGKGLSTYDYNATEKAKVDTIPSAGIGDGTLTIKQNGSVIGTFKANQNSDVEVVVAPSAGGGVSDVKVDGTSVVSGNVANINLTGKQNVLTADQLNACNSGIIASKVSGYDSHVANSDIHVTTSEKINWSRKYSKPSTGIPKTDLASDVQASLGKADTISGSETWTFVLEDSTTVTKKVMLAV